LFLSPAVAELSALKLYGAPHNTPSVFLSIRELLSELEYGRACLQNCEDLVRILIKANEALVRGIGFLKSGEANPPSGVDAKQM
jgi:hypothetical protein